MRKTILIIAFATMALICSFAELTTRTERDVYTISLKDTTTSYIQKNAPGSRDNGIIYPSSRDLVSERNMLQRDSTVERFYPDFIRLGLVETIGLIGSSDSALGVGMFGIFPDFSNLRSNFRGGKNYLFSGGLYRLGIGEWRLRWFRDAPDWTVGTNILEIIAPEAKIEKTLMATFPVYIKKRFFLRTEIPYVAITPSFGIGYYPSQYINLSGSIDVGSIGGLNVRGYVGYAAGINPMSSPQVLASKVNHKDAQTVTFPYIGIGMSMLDFLNIVPETYKEWKYHEHSAWNIGLMDMSLISSGADSSAFSTGSGKSLFSGFMFRLANASVALPFYNNQFYLGTSLMNFVVLGSNEYGLGILPLRAGYWQTILADELSTEPFIEYNYYPSTFIHLGNRVNLKISDLINISFILGFVSGQTASNTFVGDIKNTYGIGGSFSRPYLGINLGISNRVFYPSELRYNR